MPQAVCPSCDTLVHITSHKPKAVPGKIPLPREVWTLDPHTVPDPEQTTDAIEVEQVCPGTGRRV